MRRRNVRKFVGNDKRLGNTDHVHRAGSDTESADMTLTATSIEDTTKSAIATITISTAAAGGVSVTISSKVGGFVVGQVATLTATVANDTSGAGVTWTASSGTVTPVTATTAKFTAPNSPGSGITVTATSKANTTKSATGNFGITDLLGVTTYHNDGSRDGVNNQEYVLTTSNVTSGTFGKLFSCDSGRSDIRATAVGAEREHRRRRT